MARFSGPDEWTGDYWKSLLRFTSKADATSKAEILVGVNLHNFDTESPYAQLPGSPLSSEAMKIEGVKADFLLYRPPETFAAIGIAADRVMMRYEAHEALRRDTITMLRRKRQQLAAKAQQKLMQEQEQQSPTAAHRDEESEDDDDMRSVSDATTRSVHSNRELTHTEQLLRDQQLRLQAIANKTSINMECRVDHEKEVQRDQDELREFVNKKILRVDALAEDKARHKEERIKLSGERERAKLIKRDQQERKQTEKAARDVRVRKQQMEEAEIKRLASVAAKEKVIQDRNAARKAETDERKVELLAACERKEQREKEFMQAKMESQQVRYEQFIDDRTQSLEQFRELQERKAAEAASRVSYISDNKEFNLENRQAKRMSELADREFKASLRKKAETEKKRKRSLAKQRKAEMARYQCKKQQEDRENRIGRNIHKKAQVAGKMQVLRKTELDKQLEESNIITMNRTEKLERLVARNSYRDSLYLVDAMKRESKINEMFENKKLMMHERRLILFDMAQTELQAREDLGRIRLRMPTKNKVKKKMPLLDTVREMAWDGGSPTSTEQYAASPTSTLESPQQRAESAMF